MTNIHSRVAAVALASASVLALNTGARAQAYNWTGFYVGANAGYAWGNSDVKTTVPCSEAPPGYFCNNTGGFANGAAVSAAGTGSISADGFTGGGQLGYNWQSGMWVYGVETDFGAFNLGGSRSVSAHYAVPFNNITTTNIFTIGATVDAHWLYTARGRVGYAFANSNTMIYATGGLALTHLSLATSFSDNFAFNGFPGAVGSGSASATKVGWALGAGSEWAMNQKWSVKLEYLYVDFGSVTANMVVRHPGNVAYSQAISTSADLTAHIARAGINYRF